ncbi:hypothetical protein N7468_007895 [Penicillium chermesinum]|uniref:Glycoside hydrolase family 5 domain-containing protein n=1 Tax=Penicillium chermesinum TaxID=63820 RepID=A0A9W9THX9_9EURO|nr:uncharacterized protein N7468_007895 [Penicillium chermesinum]KAJ5223353.1 hypothetical protein N7468_007895 [Penicillium chermesinum]
MTIVHWLAKHPKDLLAAGHRHHSYLPASLNFTPPFHTQGRFIRDANDVPVKLASINWYGASDIYFVPGGLDVRHRDDIAQLILDLGFNSVRLPYADEIVLRNPQVNTSLIAANQDLFQESTPTALDVYHAVIDSLTAAGLLVIPNNHITTATWCCGANPCDLSWTNSYWGGQLFCPVPLTEEGWIRNWETVMRPLVQNPFVIGADLRNEVRGLWGTMYWSDWAKAAERASERLLAINPDWLMIVEGISSANDVSGAKKRPIQLSIPGRVVYSAHVYPWSGWGSLAPFSGRRYEDFASEMWKNWGYLLAEDIAPVWVGEIGITSYEPTDGDRNYWRNLVRFLKETDASWGYWALNARKASGEIEWYGLLGDEWDWESVRWDYRLEALKALGLEGPKS